MHTEYSNTEGSPYIPKTVVCRKQDSVGIRQVVIPKVSRLGCHAQVKKQIENYRFSEYEVETNTVRNINKKYHLWSFSCWFLCVFRTGCSSRIAQVSSVQHRVWYCSFLRYGERRTGKDTSLTTDSLSLSVLLLDPRRNATNRRKASDAYEATWLKTITVPYSDFGILIGRGESRPLVITFVVGCCRYGAFGMAQNGQDFFLETWMLVII